MDRRESVGPDPSFEGGWLVFLDHMIRDGVIVRRRDLEDGFRKSVKWSPEAIRERIAHEADVQYTEKCDTAVLTVLDVVISQYWTACSVRKKNRTSGRVLSDCYFKVEKHN